MMRIRNKRSTPFRLLFVLLLALAVIQTGLAESKFSFSSTPGQLSKDVIPKHYVLNLKPDLKSLAFRGTETVDMEVVRETRTVILNSLELKISNVKLAGEPDQVATIQLDDLRQTVTLTFPRNLKVGWHQLDLEFEGKLAAQANGLYFVKYTSGQEEKLLLATQMEPTDARRMFPCWDEPVFRSTFSLTVEVPHKFMAISNMPVEKEEAAGNDFKTVSFQKTPSMSSYLLVLAAGEFEALSGEVEGTRVRIIAPQGKKEEGQYALEVTKKLIPYYNDYFGIKYPLPKLDQIAIPGMGAFGAMENWGGITYSESLLLFNPSSSSQQTQEAIFSVVSHEMAHLWFGDLVTTAWWDNIWLNEGFASWMSNKATDHFNPEWNIWLRANGSKNWAMASDAFKTSHPIQQPVTSPSEAIRSFDEITYAKGSAVIRMLETYLGEEVFQQGICRYIREHQYSNATTADLWDALDRESGKPVSEIARTWTEQPGFPLIRVKSACQAGNRTLALDQTRFSVNNPDATPLQWLVPVTIARYSSHPSLPTVLLRAKSMDVPGGDCGTPVKLNAGNVGYYRVKYDLPMLDQLQKTVNKDLPVADRLNLLSDTSALVDADLASYTDYLDLAESLRQDTSLAIWEEILGTLGGIDRLQIGQPGREPFQAYARSLLEPALDRIGWDPKPGEGKNVVLLRSNLISTLGTFKDEKVITEARRRFQEFLRKPETLNPDLHSAVFSVVGRYSDRTTYEQLNAFGRKTDSTEEKIQYYSAMHDALDPDLARESLQRTLTDELPMSMAPYSVFGVAYGGEHAALAWEFARRHYKELTAKLPSMGKDSYFPQLVSGASDAAQAAELEAFCKPTIAPDAWKEVEKATERIRFQAKLKQRELPCIDRWIQNRKPLENHSAAKQ